VLFNAPILAATDYGNPPGIPPNVKALPAGFEAGTTNEIIFVFVAGAAAVLFALPWAIRAATKGNWIPALVLTSGLICCLEEAMLDMLGHLHWADDLAGVYTNFGIEVPALIPLCYVAFYGLISYFCYFVIRNGATFKHFVMLMAMAGIFDAVMETIGINLNVYEYYGIQPFTLFGFPYWWGFINGAGIVCVGAIVAYAEPRLKGWSKLLLLLAAPYGMAITYFTVGWIHLIAHNSALPEWARWVACAIMMVEAVAFMKVLHHFTGAKAEEKTPNWTLPRMFAFHMVPSSTRNRMWKRMAEEGGLPAERHAAAY